MGQRRDKILHPIYYAGKSLNETQNNYTVTEQELLALLFAWYKGYSAYKPFFFQVLDGEEECEAKVDQMGTVAARV